MIEADAHKIAANQVEALDQMLHSPGWLLYSKALAQKQSELLRELQVAVRKGDFTSAALKQVALDVLSDCLDIPKLEAANLQLTLTMHEEIGPALERERIRT